MNGIDWPFIVMAVAAIGAGWAKYRSERSATIKALAERCPVCGNGNGTEKEHPAKCSVPGCSDSVIKTAARLEQMEVYHHTMRTKVDNLEVHMAMLPDLKEAVTELFKLTRGNGENISYIRGQLDKALNNGG